jgi:hypothetical protein
MAHYKNVFNTYLKMKYSIWTTIFGLCLLLYGVIQKILHTPKADPVLLTSKFVLGLATILIVINIFNKKN